MAKTTILEDHKPPKGSPVTVTSHGVTVTIDPASLDDLDVLEALYDMQHSDEDPNGAFEIVVLLRKLFGDDYRRVKDALRDPETGRIPGETLNGFLTDVFEKAAPNS